MRIMTYNIQSGRDAWGQLHINGTKETIQKLAPDICALNEVRVGCSDSGSIDQSQYLAKESGLQGYFAKAITLNDGFYGIALLSKFPVSEFEVHAVPDVPLNEREKGYYESRVIYRACIETPEGDLAVYGTHFGLMKGERVNAVKLLLDLISVETLPLVFLGDLNMEPDDELIKHIEKHLTNTVTPTTGFTHHTLHLHGTIDYIFVKGLKASTAQSAFSFASDHLPVYTETRME